MLLQNISATNYREIVRTLDDIAFNSVFTDIITVVTAYLFVRRASTSGRVVIHAGKLERNAAPSVSGPLEPRTNSRLTSSFRKECLPSAKIKRCYTHTFLIFYI